ncbi:hypothetical protein AAC387_Pa07g1555 [Persea americana]
MEDIAENYLNKLIHRSMIQAVGKGSCRLHGVMRDLAQSIAEEDNFCMLHHGKEERQDSKARRLSIQFNGGDISRSSASMPRLCSFFVFGKDVIPSSSLNRISSTFRQLRVPRLEDDASIHRVPDELVNLFNLRAPIFGHCYHRKGIQAPSGIYDLKCLQSQLGVEANAEIVQQVGNLTQLRNLRMTKVRKDYGKALCSSIQRMKGLHKLCIIANNGETL